MNWVDYLLALIIVCSIISGFAAGFARVSIGTAATFIGIFAGFWCYGIVGAYFQDYVSSRPVANLIGFVLIFGGIILCGALLARLVATLFKWMGLSWLDRFLGAGFGTVRGVLIAVAFVTVFLAFAPDPPPRSVTDSKVLPYVMEASNVLSYATPREIKDSFRDTKERVKRIWETKTPHKPLRRTDA